MKILALYLSGIAFITFLNVNTANAQWIAQQSGIEATLSDVVMLDSVTAIAVGRNGSILRTEDAGETWIDMSLPLAYGGFWNAVSFFDFNHGMIVGDSGIVFTTSDAGKGWNWHRIPDNRKCFSALGTGPGRFYVGTDSGWIYKTLDMGATWTSEKISNWQIRTLFAWRGVYVMGLPVYALTPFSLCSSTEFPEGSWKETVLPEFQGLGSEGFDAEFSKGGGPGYIVGVQGDFRSAPAILKNATSDTVWKSTGSGILRDGEFYGVSAPSEKTVYVCGSNGMMYKSSDAGGTWIDQTVTTRRSIRAVFFLNETRGFAVGDSGLILYSANNSSTGVQGRVRLTLKSKKDAAPVHVRLYDLKGRTLGVNANSAPGMRRTRLSQGVYLAGNPGRFIAKTVQP
jgi:photosystem II stability/assembly factor-like uncharacterized protein